MKAKDLLNSDPSVLIGSLIPLIRGVLCYNNRKKVKESILEYLTSPMTVTQLLDEYEINESNTQEFEECINIMDDILKELVKEDKIKYEGRNYTPLR